MTTVQRKVLDISHHNTVSSWTSIKNAGIVGVIHKATEGTSYTDNTYASRKSAAKSAGLLWGAYHFAHGGNVQKQVDYFLKVVGVDDETLYALDWEDNPNGPTMTAAEAKQFLQAIEQRIGANRCVVYSGNTAKSALGSKVDPYFGQHRMWVAQYGSTPSVQASWKTYWLWQYSDGNVGPSPHGCPGISGEVDTNSYPNSNSQLTAEWSGAGATPVPQGKPTVRKGDQGPYVRELQADLNVSLFGCNLTVDGDFGTQTDQQTRNYQRSRGLSVDGICGPNTWSALDNQEPPIPPPQGLLSPEELAEIILIAKTSDIYQYNWTDRGVAPPGYTEGMALAYAVTHRQLMSNVSWAVAMAKANTHNADKDVLSWYAGKFDALNMSNNTSGPDTLRHLFVLILGLGMRESSGRHCEGRDQSASNVSSDTAETGLFQQSWNSAGATPEMSKEMDFFDGDQTNCFLDTFKIGVSCTSSEWACYGSGTGYHFQEMCKSCPTYAAQSCGSALRTIRQHWGPINRYEVELRTEADIMLHDVMDYLDSRVVSA